ncbi:MAG: T9SS type A sorting domain-containing protein [Bacteroidota bacterium]
MTSPRSYITIVYDLVTNCRHRFEFPVFPECDCTDIDSEVEELVPYADRDNKGEVTIRFNGLPFSTIEIGLFPAHQTSPPQTIQLDETGTAIATFTGLVDLTYSLEIINEDQCHELRYIDIPRACEIEEGISEPQLEAIVLETRNDVPSSDISISPNPTSGVLTIYAEQTGEDLLEVSIYNTNGQLVFKDKWQANVKQNVDQLPAGVYFMQVQNHTSVHRLPFVISQ